jgi:hypothetical protein
MGLQATYSVYGLDFEKTYNCLQKANDVERLSDIVKGNFDFWLAINGKHVRIQISNKGTVNVWGQDKARIKETVKKLSKRVVNNEDKECEEWILKNWQRMGSEKLVTDTRVTDEKSSEILEPNPDELSVFMQIPRDSFACSLADEHLKRKYPEWYRRNKKTFDDMRRMNYGFSGFISNPQPRKRKVNRNDKKRKVDRQ